MIAQAKRVLVRVASLSLAAFLIVSSVPPAMVLAAGSLTVSGTVTNQSGGGVINVSVYATAPGGSTTLYGPSTTNSSGAYSLGIDPGTYDIHFNPPSGSGFNPIVNNNYVVSANQTLNVQLTSPQHLLSGTLRDSSGNVLPSMQLYFYSTTNGSAYVTTTTDASGHFSIAANADTYFLSNVYGTISNVGGSFSIGNIYSPTDSRIPKLNLTTADLAQDLTIPLTTLAVTVKDSFGNPVSGANVTSRTWTTVQFPMITGTGSGYSDSATHNASTNGSGVAALPVYMSTYPAGYICATISGNQVCNTTSVTVSGGGGSLTLQQPPTHILSGTLRDGSGNVAPSMQLYFYSTTNNAAFVTTTTDTSGHFSIAANADTYFLSNVYGTISGIGGSFSIGNIYSPTDSRIPKLNLTTADLVQDITIPTATLSVTVKDSSGNPVSGANVTSRTWTTVQFPMIIGTGSGYSDSGTHNANTNATGVAALPVYTSTYPAGYVCATINGNQVCNATSVTVGSGGGSLTLQQPPTHLLSGTLRDSSGNVLPSMQLYFYSTTNGSAYVTTTTDASGHFSIAANADTYFLSNVYGTISNVGGSFSIGNIYSPTDSRIPKLNLTTADLAQDLTIPLTTLAVTVKDSFGNPVSGANVTSRTWTTVQFPMITGTGSGYSDSATHNASTNGSGVAALPVYMSTYPAGYICATVSGNQLCNTTSITINNGSGSLLFQAAPQAPPAPTGLTATSPTSTAPILHWNTVSVASSYNIYRNSTKIGTSTTTSFTDSALILSGTYSYNVTAVSALNVESSASNTISVVFNGQGPVVTNVQVSPGTISTNQTATLSANVSDSFATVTNAEYFEGTDPGEGNGTSMAIVTGVASATLPSTLSVGQHTFTVRARNSLGNWTRGTLPTATLTVTLPVFSGKVTNSINTGLSSVRIDVVSPANHANIIATTTTDSSGNYNVSIPTPGTYDIIYTPSDTVHYQTLTRTNINLSSSTVLNVQLASVMHTISGTIRNSSGTPLPSLQVYYAPVGSNGFGGVLGLTDANGHYSITVTAGTHFLNNVTGGVSGFNNNVNVHPAGNDYSRAIVVDATNSDIVQDITLPTTSISVTVKDGYGNLVSGSSVTSQTWSTIVFSIATGYTPGYSDVINHSATTNSSGVAAVPAYTTTYPAGYICATISGNQVCNSGPVTASSNGTTTVLIQASQLVPPAPTGLTAPSPTVTAPVLSWNTVSVASSYNIYRDGLLIGSTGNTPYTDSGLTADGTYTYIVKAVSALNVESLASSATSVVYSIPRPTVTNVQISPNSINVGQNAVLSASVSDSFATVTNAEYFEGTDPGEGNGTAMTIVGGTATATLPSTLPLGQHIFMVRARNSLGNWTRGTLPTAAVTVTLPTLTGRVLNGANIGIANTRVDVVSPGNHANVFYTTTTNSSGNYAISITTPDTYDVIYTPADTTYLPTTKTNIDLTLNQTVDIVLVLRPHFFSGTLKDINNIAIKNATITLHNAGGQNPSTTTLDDGFFALEVNPAAYSVTISGTKAASPNSFIPTTFSISGGSFDLTSDVTQNFTIPAYNKTFITKSALTHAIIGSVALSAVASGSVIPYTGSDFWNHSTTSNTISDANTGAATVVLLRDSAYIVVATPPANQGVLTTTFSGLGPDPINPPTTDLELNANIKHLDGHLFLNNSSTAIPNATVSLSGPLGSFQATTDGSGYFNVTGAAGNYSLSVSGSKPSGSSLHMPDSFSLSGTIDLTTQNVTQDLTLATAKASVTAKSSFGALLDNVGITLNSAAGTGTTSLFPGGTFNVTDAASGVTGGGVADMYVVTGPAYTTKATPSANSGYIVTNLAAGNTITVDTAWDIVLDRDLRNFSGTITDKSGTPVKGATVQLDGNEQDQHYTMTTNDNGLFAHDVAPNNSYNLHISGMAAASQSTGAYLPENYSLNRTVSVTSDTVQNVTINTVKLDIVARDDHLNLISGVGIAFSSSGSQNGFSASSSSIQRTTNSSGYTYIDMLVGTTYTISATPPANIGYVNTTFNGTSPITQDSETILEFQNHIPGPPIAHGASPTKTSPVINWAVVTNADHYNVYRDDVYISTTPALSYTDNGLIADGDYTYKISAVSADNYEGAKSNPVVIKYDTTAPGLGDPSFSANPKQVGQTSVLSATAGDGSGSGVAAGEYFIGSTDPGEGNGTPMPYTSGTVSATIGTGLSAGTYDFHVRAKDNLGTWSVPKSVQLVVSRPAAPTNLTAPTPTNQDPALSWTASPDAAKYFVYRDNVKIGETTTTTFTDTALPDGVYSYKITAVNSFGDESLATDPFSVMLDKTAPTIDPSQLPLPNSYGWNNSDVTVTFACADNLSGVATCAGPTTITTVGADQNISGAAEDNAGNTASSTQKVSIDKTDPTITYTLAPAPNSKGWNNGDVIVTFHCDDALSGTATCTAPVTVSAEGGDIQVPGSATDKAGNAASIIAHIKLDKTRPVISYTVAPAPNAHGWHKNDIIVTFICTDALSGIDTCSGPVTVSAEGASQTVTGMALDNAGNTQTIAATINLDKTAPTLTPSLSAAPNSNGWNNGPTTVTYSCSDTLSGIVTCPESMLESADGTYELSGTAVDNADNQTTAGTVLKIDQTAPSISYTLTPLPNSHGWNRADVLVTFTCHDDTSGIASCTSPQTVSTEGGNIEIPGQAIDNAGNVTGVTAHISLDKTNPTISASINPAPNTHGWHKNDVIVTFTCADVLSGIDTCSGPVAVSAEGANQSITGTAVDNAGNTASVTAHVSLDKTAPTITATTTPTPNADGWNKSDATVTFSCNDALSGIETCPAPMLVNTESANTSVSGTAVDNAGNTASVTTTVKLDKTAPVVNSLSWSSNPLMQGQTTTLSASVTETLSGIAHVYYSIEGGTPQPMTYDSASNTWKATFGSSLAVNTYNVGVWAVDNADNASPPLTDVLAVTNAANGHVSGHAWLIPTAGDTLPIGQGSNNAQPTEMVVGFSGQQGATTSVDVHYIVQNNQNEFDFSSTSVDWVVVQADGVHASILVHGDLTVYVNGVMTLAHNVAMRLDVVLGTNGAADQITIKIWNANLNPSTATPTYLISDSDIPTKSQVRIQ